MESFVSTSAVLPYIHMYVYETITILHTQHKVIIKSAVTNYY